MIVIRQKEFNSKAQKARRRNWDIQQGLSQSKETNATSQAKMIGEEKTKNLLDRYTRNTKTKVEGAIKTFLGDIGGKKVTRTLAKDRKDLENMERARKLVNEGRKVSRDSGPLWSSERNVNDHINEKGQNGVRFHNSKSDIEYALKNSKNKQYLKKQRINNLKAAGAVAATVGTVAGIGYGIKKAVDKNKKENGKEK